MQTFSQKPADVQKKWVVVDAEGLVVGRLASVVASRLRGKHKPSYTPHVDCGDHVIVINAEKIKVTGDKLETMYYYRHSGYPGGLREEKLSHLLQRRPEEVVRRAVKGMVPHTRLGTQQLRKLKVYAGKDHPHEAQQPVPAPAGGVNR